MSGKPSQRKGREAERELAEVLRGYGFTAEPGRALNYGTEADVSGLPGLHLEVKRCERLQLPAWIKQAERDAKRFDDGAPTVAGLYAARRLYAILPLLTALCGVFPNRSSLHG